MRRLVVLALAVVPFAAWAGSSGVMPDGPDAYLVMHTGKTGFVSSGSLQRKAYEEATKFCSDRSLVMETISMDSKRSRPLGGFPEATLRFKCMSADGSTGSAVAAPAADKYTQLEQLKRVLDSGALTQEEFDREKAKVLGQ